MRGLATVLSASILGLPAFAEVPRVAVDIPPVHALVAQVMGDIGAPDLVVPPGASPHDYALRPSEAGLLQSADLVVWVGPELAPWLSDPIETLAGEAHHLTLLEAEGIRRLSFREGATFEAHDHGDHAGHDHEGEHDHDDHGHDHDEHAHDDHGHGDDHSHDDDHGHEDDHTHEAHADEHEAHEDHGHDHGHAHSHDGVDPHAWLDPANAAVWLNVIAEELSELDPDNADVYRANAEAAAAELDALSDTVATRMSTLDGGFIVFHDAYHYFEARFGIEATGAISLSDATPPSPARMAEIRDLVAAAGVSCVFVEPQFNPGVVEAVFAESEARIVEIDPLGAQLTPGPELYEALLLDMAASFEACLQP